MSYNHLYPSSQRCCINSSSPPDSDSGNNKSKENPTGQFKIYQFFVFCIPILFTFILLFLFYLFYLRPRRVNWSALRMTTATTPNDNDIATVELGLKKELREMLPIIVYKESFSVRDTQCSVCLGDYQAEDRLQQIPACRHTFHIDCIDSWLSTHSTCPLCRLSLLASHKSPKESPDILVELSHESSVTENNIVTSLTQMPQACEEEEAMEFSGLRNGEPRTIQSSFEEDARSSEGVDWKKELSDVGNATVVRKDTGGSFA